MFWFQRYNRPSQQGKLFFIENKPIVLTLAKATGGSLLSRAVAAFSYSGASRLPNHEEDGSDLMRKRKYANLQWPHQGA